jgi:diphosphomevalonate decarboxylase
MNLAGLHTRTTVTFSPDLEADRATVDGRIMTGDGLARIVRHLDHVRALAGSTLCAEVISASNFPTGAGIASSASAFAALSLAATAALGLVLSERALSSLARLGSGSAARSVPGGFVEWHPGDSHESSTAESIAPADHWLLTDLVAIVSRAHKRTGSTEGHSIAASSPLQAARIASAPARLDQCRRAILARDFEAFADVVELDSNVMHAIMMTGQPSLMYWQPETMAIMHAVRDLRAQGVPVCFTIDAGPNVHCICAPGAVDTVRAALVAIPGVLEILEALPGGRAYLESDAGGA